MDQCLQKLLHQSHEQICGLLYYIITFSEKTVMQYNRNFVFIILIAYQQTLILFVGKFYETMSKC